MNQIIEDDLKNIYLNSSNLFKSYFLKNSNIFITGATGFFGKWLLKSILYIDNNINLNITIYALSRNPKTFLKKNPLFLKEKRLKFIKGDIRSFKFPSNHFNYIIHAATDSDDGLNKNNPFLMSDTIVLGTKRVLDLAKKQSNLKSFLFISSGAIYGKQPHNISHINEKDDFYYNSNNPYSSYSEGKRIAELYCSMCFDNFKLPIKIARCFAFVGPFLPLDKHFAIGNFILNVINDENIVINGDGKALRSYMYSSDLIIWLLNILLIGEVNVPYNVGSDHSISILDLALLVNQFQKRNKKVKLLNSYNSLSRNKYVPDISRSVKKLNLNLNINLNESIKRTIEFNL